MGALLAAIPVKDWFYGTLVVALIAFGFYERAHLIHEGEQHEAAALKASSAKLQAQTDKITAELQARATMAERAYDKEHLLVANMPIGPVRLCVAANGGRGVSKSGAKVGGNVATGTDTGPVQPVPSGDTSVPGPNIGPMLSALAASADQVSATLREFQSR